MSHSEAKERWKLGKSFLQESQQHAALHVSSASASLQAEKHNQEKDYHNDDDQVYRKPPRSNLSNPPLFHSRKSTAPLSKSTKNSESSLTNQDDNDADFVVPPSLELIMDDSNVDIFDPATESNGDSTAAKKPPIFFSETAARLVVSEVPPSSHVATTGAEQMESSNKKPIQNAAIPIETPLAPSKTPARRLSGWKLLAVITALLLVVVAIIVGVALRVSKRSHLSSFSSSQNEPSERGSSLRPSLSPSILPEQRPSLRPSLSPSIQRMIAPSSNITVSPSATLAPFIVVGSSFSPMLLTLEPIPQPNSDTTNGNKPTLLSSGHPSTKPSSPSLPPTLLPSFLVTDAPSVPSLVQVSTLQPSLVAATGPPD